MPDIYDAPTQITYYDLDCRGRLKLSAFLRMAHIAADANVRDLHIGFDELEPRAMSFILQRFGLDINRMPAYGETVSLRTWPASVIKGTFIRRGDMRDTEGRTLMSWVSLWVLLDLNERKILRPSALPVTLPEIGTLGSPTETQKINFPEDWGEAFTVHTHTVRYADVDTNLHMNNTIYGDLIGNALYLREDAPATAWASVQINYLSETRLGEAVEVTCRRQGSVYWVAGHAHGKATFFATVTFTPS
jgi:acyl-ACP thioesterase